MKIRIVSRFHNVDMVVSLRKPLSLNSFRSHQKKACKNKGCMCDTRLYIETNNIYEANVRDESGLWKIVDEYDMILRDAGYGVKL